MATTTNFGWETPDDTDLVKDGAAAIRTLGGAIDTSLVDLKGGTTGQVLSKASNTDMDFSWIAVDPLTILDAKGDLISATAADTPARLAVGTNGEVLTADSTTSTGLKWAPIAASSYSGCSLYATANQSLSNNTEAAIAFTAETFDTNSYHDTSTNNSRITIPSNKAGKYLISGFVTFDANATGNRAVWVYKNGSASRYTSNGPNNGGSQARAISFNTILDLAVGDYIQIYAHQNSGSSLNILNGASNTSVEVSLLGA